MQTQKIQQIALNNNEGLLRISKKTTEPQKLTWDPLRIHSTTNYDLFDYVNSNRPVSEKHVGLLISKILKKNLLRSNPINVKEGENGKLLIMEGQHRLAAAKFLNIPIYFIVDNNFEVEDIASINSTRKKWSPEDYAQHFIKEGKEDYKILVEFSKKHKLPINTSVGLLSGRTSNPNVSLIKQFQTGYFQVSDLEHANNIVKMIKDFQKFNIRNFMSKTFVSVFSRIASLTEYDHTTFMVSFPDRFRLFRECTTKEEYKQIFAKIYNEIGQNKLDFKNV